MPHGSEFYPPEQIFWRGANARIRSTYAKEQFPSVFSTSEMFRTLKLIFQRIFAGTMKTHTILLILFLQTVSYATKNPD